MPDELISLTWQAQVTLASGYAAYLICYRGIRSHHSAHDTIFIVLMFGMIAAGELWLTNHLNPIISGIFAFLLTIVVSLVWRRHGMSLLSYVLRNANSTWSDDTPSAWARLQENREHPLSQISVLLKNGTWLHCNETSVFNNMPYSPCILGSNGDILMYLTSIKEKSQEERTQDSTIDQTYGSRLTYVPAAEIARVNIRLMSSINHRQKEGASLEKSSEQAP